MSRSAFWTNSGCQRERIHATCAAHAAPLSADLTDPLQSRHRRIVAGVDILGEQSLSAVLLDRHALLHRAGGMLAADGTQSVYERCAIRAFWSASRPLNARQLFQVTDKIVLRHDAQALGRSTFGTRALWALHLWMWLGQRFLALNTLGP